MVHSIGKSPQALADLGTVTRLLDQYYYPSNTGSWADTLGEFMFRCVAALSFAPLNCFSQQSQPGAHFSTCLSSSRPLPGHSLSFNFARSPSS